MIIIIIILITLSTNITMMERRMKQWKSSQLISTYRDIELGIMVLIVVTEWT